jgi:hypothetical protein
VGQERVVGNSDGKRLHRPVHDRLGSVEADAGHSDRGASPSSKEVVGVRTST